MQKSQRAKSASHLIESNDDGTSVYDMSGKRIGMIERMVIDKRSGRVVYTVASFGGFPGMGGDTYTIPWNALAYDTRLAGFTSRITPEKLSGAPAFSRNGGDFWGDYEREEALHTYYGSPYPWAE